MKLDKIKQQETVEKPTKSFAVHERLHNKIQLGLLGS